MYYVLTAIEEFFLTLSENEKFVEKHPGIVEVTCAYQDFLGKLHDTNIDQMLY